ncbi:hypothetical protein [Salirhabdus sp. Marseille-P4669]|uniref:hypothetical protein n=1 Tax=Salirhabdus sp. Marseille-P4669 TaxID=2042310 RepID=UPI000C7B507C|nr:hypothetical protein [Salirhabdus sp. Marseille-P4669]
MERRTKATLIFVTSIVSIYVIFAMIETANLSSKTVDEAFGKFINGEFKTEVAQNEIDKEFYRKGNYTFVPFEFEDSVSLVQFEKGIFGWKKSYHSHYKNRDYSHSGFYGDGESLFHGIIPKDIVSETKTIKVNGKNADIVMLNNEIAIWIIMDIQNNFDNLNIDALDKFGNVIAEL